jgi:hypothetical protein
MKRFNKYIAVFLTLAVLANGVFASQMNVLMIDKAGFETSSSIDSSAPCHEKDSIDQTSTPSGINGNDCCDGDCNGCYLGSTITAKNSALMPIIHQASINMDIDNSQLSAHSSNLYRPPILI